MSKKPLKHFTLRENVIQNKDFLRKVNRAKTVHALRKLVSQASPEEIRILQNMIIAHFDPQQAVGLDLLSI